MAKKRKQVKLKAAKRANKSAPKLRVGKKPVPASGQVYTKAQDIVFRELSESGIAVINLLNPSDIFRIEGIACKVWLAIDGKKDLSEINRQVSRLTSQDLDWVASHTKAFIGSLLKAGLIKRI